MSHIKYQPHEGMSVYWKTSFQINKLLITNKTLATWTSQSIKPVFCSLSCNIINWILGWQEKMVYWFIVMYHHSTENLTLALLQGSKRFSRFDSSSMDSITQCLGLSISRQVNVNHIAQACTEVLYSPTNCNSCQTNVINNTLKTDNSSWRKNGSYKQDFLCIWISPVIAQVPWF